MVRADKCHRITDFEQHRPQKSTEVRKTTILLMKGKKTIFSLAMLMIFLLTYLVVMGMQLIDALGTMM